MTFASRVRSAVIRLGRVGVLTIALGTTALVLAACDSADDPDAVVEEFFQASIDAAPPDGDADDAEDALELLTTETRQRIEAEGGTGASALALLIGWQDVPDDGFEVADPVEDGDSATVNVTLRYSGGDTQRVVQLEREDDRWRIASVTGEQSSVQFALVQAVSGGAITFDPAAFLSGEEALDAAREDGVIGADEDLPNDFYIRREDTESVTLPVSDGFQAILIDVNTIQPAPPVGYDEFEQLLAGTADASGYYGLTPSDFPMDLEIRDGAIVLATQQYVP